MNKAQLDNIALMLETTVRAGKLYLPLSGTLEEKLDAYTKLKEHVMLVFPEMTETQFEYVTMFLFPVE
jgi:hypothetical protein